MKSFLRNGIMMSCVFVMVMTGCGTQKQSEVSNDTHKQTEITNSTEKQTEVSNDVVQQFGVKASKKVFEGAVAIELSDTGILVEGQEISSNVEEAVYAANDIVFYLEGQGVTYGEGETEDEHTQAEADAHTVVHITKPGIYVVSGSLSAGQIAVDLGKDAKENPEAVVTLILNGVDIECSVAPAVIFYNVYECGTTEEENAGSVVDTMAAGANVLIADESVNYVIGSYVARIYKPDSVEVSEDGMEVLDAKKLHKYDAAFYSKMTMNMNGDENGTGILYIDAENEGLDSELHLTINGGNIHIESGNDGINTNEDGISVTTMNGGTLTIRVTGETGEGDGIDSNGWLVINGGTLIAEGCSFSMDAGIDSDMGIHINGGTVIATGNMLDRISESSRNYAVFQFASSQKAGNIYTLKNAEGKIIAEYTPENDFSYLIFSTGDMKAGSYTMWQGENQLAGANGDRIGGMQFSGGMEFPENMEIPENMKRPEGTEMPEGRGFPEGMEKPEGMKRPEGTEMPEGMERPEGDRGGFKRGENVAVSTEFVLVDGGNYFTNVSIAENANAN